VLQRSRGSSCAMLPMQGAAQMPNCRLHTDQAVDVQPAVQGARCKALSPERSS
jgi:hypothetical protein